MNEYTTRTESSYHIKDHERFGNACQMYKRPVTQDQDHAGTSNFLPKQNGGMRLQIKSISVQLLRFLLYKTIALLKACRNTTAQMWVNNNIQNVYSSLTRSKKIIIFAIVLLILLLYMWPTWLRWPSNRMSVDPMDVCLDAKLESFRRAREEYNAIVNYQPQREEEHKFLPFIGNGYIGSVVTSDSQLYLKYGRALALPVNYYPIVEVKVEGFPSKEAQVTDIENGLVYKVQCFQLGTVCVTVASQYYAHRSRSTVLVQEFRVHNPTDLPVTVEFRHVGVSDWQGSIARTGKMSSGRTIDVEYKTVMGTIPVDQSSGKLVYGAAITHSRITDMVTVKPGGTMKRHMYTAVRYIEKPQTAVAMETDLQLLADRTEQDVKNVINVESNMLRQQHTQVWNRLWMSGFGISMSKAADALNGDKINMTMYYLLSNSPSAIHEEGRDTRELEEYHKRLHFPDRCYEGHHTLQNSKMWEDVLSASSIIEQVNTWIITLEKQGCATMIRAGAEGVLQAMILSFGALSFKNDHLEFGAHPKDLHRDYFFRRINYGNNTHVNISVVVGDDNKANLFVALDRNDKPYYACDAGCLDAPMKLSNELMQFPVKLTDPHTSILYITYDKQHMEDLKHAIHFKDIGEAPAHEHHVIALHKHGHHYGGLPMIFWFSIGFLIMVFHLFLFKLIFNEYCQNVDSRYTRGKYYL